MNFIIYSFAILKNIIYGSSVLFVSKLNDSTHVLDILAIRFMLSFIALFLLNKFHIIRINFKIRNFTKKETYMSENLPIVLSLLLTAIFEPVLYMLFETLGIAMSSTITVSVLLSLAPISSSIAETLILKEKTSLKKIILLIIGIAGVIYIAINTDTNNGVDTVEGIIFTLLAVICGSLFCVFSRKSSKAYSSIEITYFTTFLGALIFNLINIVRHFYTGTIHTYFSPLLNIDNLIGFVFLSIVCSILAVLMNNFALARMPVTTMAAFGGLSTLVGVLLGVFLNNEHFYMYHLIGMILIFIRIIGVSYITIKESKMNKIDN